MKERGGAIKMKDSLSVPWCMKKQKDFAPNAVRSDHTFDHFITLRLLLVTFAVQRIPIPGGGKGDDSGVRRLKQESEQSGESNQMTSSQQMVRRGKQGSWGGGLRPCNNKV